MRSPGNGRLAAGLLLFGTFPIGCATPSPGPLQPAAAVNPKSQSEPETIQQVAHQEQGAPPTSESTLPAPTVVPPAQGATPPQTTPFAGMSVLSPDALVQEVLNRSPSLAQMVAAWQAAASRYPQVTSLDDPTLDGTLAPSGIGTIEDRNRGYRLTISQKYPWFGKRELRGQNAQAEARAAGDEVADTKLRLIESARIAFYDYYRIARALEVNEEGLRLLREFRASAVSRYEKAKASEQDYRQADVEIGRLEERALTLKRMRAVAIARINTLMHLLPDSPLPPPPQELDIEVGLPEPRALRALALGRRPDLQALADRIAAEEASLALAYKEYYPDLEWWAGYDTFWVEKQLRPQIGMRMNLPARLKRRDAAVREAQAKLAERRAELARQTDQVNYQVQQAYEEVRESEQAVRLYEDKILTAARKNLAAGRDAYSAGTIPFVSLIEAQRNLVNLRDRYYEAVAEYHRRRATLERVIGGPLTR